MPEVCAPAIAALVRPPQRRNLPRLRPRQAAVPPAPAGACRESTLHTLELLGGWPGAYLAASRLRHKSRKRSFRVKRAAVTLLNLAALVAVLYVRSRLA